jgi:multiple antibiotic resistance protein
MDTTTSSFIHLVFVGFVALFPPVNPIGKALVVDPLLRGLGSSARKIAAFKITFYCFIVCAVAALAGSWLFRLFGISIPVVQVAGGIMICKMGWQLLSADAGVTQPLGMSKDTPSHAVQQMDGSLFYPIAFPVTTGAGTISVLLTLSAHGHAQGLETYFLNLSALFVAIVLMCIVIFMSYAFTPAFLHRIGQQGQQIVNSLSAFLVFCVGIQIVAEGVTTLMKG